MTNYGTSDTAMFEMDLDLKRRNNMWISKKIKTIYTKSAFPLLVNMMVGLILTQEKNLID